MIRTNIRIYSNQKTIRTNIQIYSYQKNDMNEYPNIFVSKNDTNMIRTNIRSRKYSNIFKYPNIRRTRCKFILHIRTLLIFQLVRLSLYSTRPIIKPLHFTTSSVQLIKEGSKEWSTQLSSLRLLPYTSCSELALLPTPSTQQQRWRWRPGSS